MIFGHGMRGRTGLSNSELAALNRNTYRINGKWCCVPEQVIRSTHDRDAWYSMAVGKSMDSKREAVNNAGVRLDHIDDHGQWIMRY